MDALLQLAADYTEPRFEDWRRVPEEIIRHYKIAAALAEKLPPDLPGTLLVNPDTDQLWLISDAPGMQKLASAHVSGRPPEDLENWVLVKVAGSAQTLLGGIKGLYDAAGKLVGGPSPLARTLAGAALTGLGGYGAGKLYDTLLAKPLHKLAPRYFSGKTKAAPIGAALGALAGGGLGAWHGSADVRANNVDWLGNPQHAAYGKQAAFDQMLKEAAGRAGALHTPSVPVDAFNRAIWSDAVQPTNPFGTKDPFGSNEQRLRTPPQAAAAASGLVSAASAGRGGSDYVSPMDIAKVAVGAGAGLGSGLIAGKVLGGLAGLTPSAQRKLQDLGMWGGLVTTAAKSLLK